MDREGGKREGEVDSDAQLEQGRQLAKAGSAPKIAFSALCTQLLQLPWPAAKTDVSQPQVDCTDVWLSGEIDS